MHRELEGKVAVVTGASQGIGRAITLALSDSGVSVVIAARNREKLSVLEDEIIERDGKVLAVTSDVKSIDDCKHLAQRALDVYGQIDILVNSAGRGLGGGGPIELSDPAEVADMVQVNLLGLYHCTYAVLPSMKSRSSGHIINISSVAGVAYFPPSPMYSATKFGIRAFSEGLRNQVQNNNIRVTTIYPGETRTPMLARYSPEKREKLLEPVHIASLVLHILKYPEKVSVNQIVVRPTSQEE